jgi:hypothetical protein
MVGFSSAIDQKQAHCDDKKKLSRGLRLRKARPSAKVEIYDAMVHFILRYYIVRCFQGAVDEFMSP